MKLDFSQKAVHHMHGTLCDGFGGSLQNAIHQCTGLQYTCIETENGYFLQPVIRVFPFRNFYVPEIEIDISLSAEHITLNLIGRPVKSVRGFMNLWFGGLLAAEAALMIAAITSNLEKPLAILIPLGMCLLGYLFGEITTKVTFFFVLKAIRKAFP